MRRRRRYLSDKPRKLRWVGPKPMSNIGWAQYYAKRPGHFAEWLCFWHLLLEESKL